MRVSLSSTESVCPVCLHRVAGERIAEGENIYLEKTCPDHGHFRTVLWRGLPSYQAWGVRDKLPSRPPVCPANIARGCPFDCGLCPDHRQHTCCVVMEVTSRCNLTCPYCFAAAGGRRPDPGRDQIESWCRMLLASGGPFNLQISGGEPTVRNDLPEIILLARSLGFNFVQLNTNGIRLAESAEYAASLKFAGLGCVFLQFDGLTDDIYHRVRGRALLRTKLDAIRHCAENELGVVLVPTLVPGVNIGQIGEIIRFAIAQMPAVRAVHFQPVSYVGRHPGQPRDEDRVTIPEVLREIERQTEGGIRASQFHPGSGENAYCSFHGKFVVRGGVIRPSSKPAPSGCCGPVAPLVQLGNGEGARRARRFVARHWTFPEEIASGQDGAHTDSLDAFLAEEKDSFCISGMAFQDAWNLDLDRLRECYIHAVRPDQRLYPLCAYNLTDTEGRTLYRAASEAGHVETRESLLQYELAKVRETLRWVRLHSPFYRERLANITADQIQSASDLQRLPFTTADDLADRSAQFLCVSQSEVSRVVTLDTSGTTGGPKRVYFSVEDQELTVRFFQQALATFSTAQDRILVGLPGERPGSVGDLLARAIARFGVAPVPHGPIGDVSSALAVLDREQVTCIIGVPVQVLSLARADGKRRLRSVVLCSDHVSDGLIETLKQAWGCAVFEHYGMTEMGLGGGVDCACHSGYHLREKDLYFEIVDPSTGTPVPLGQSGEIVFTTLTRKATPLIRYRTGDISRLLPGRCACGRITRRLDRVRTRKSEPVSLSPHGNLSIADLDDRLFRIPGVNDFGASLARGKLTVTAFPAAPHLEAQLMRAVGSVPAIARATAAGDLTIDVKTAPSSFRTTSEKRRIQCCTS